MSKKCNESACAKKTSIGGQALIEGIMMRGPKMTAMAVRNPEGEIVLEKWETKTVTRAKITRLPIIRGVFGFIDSMVFGYKCLMRSAEISGLDEIEAEAEKQKKEKKKNKAEKKADEAEETAEIKVEEAAAEEAPLTETEAASEQLEDGNKDEGKDEKKDGKKDGSSPLMTGIMIISTVLGVLLAVGLFVMLPSYIYKWCTYLFPALAPDNLALSSLIKSAFEGVLRIAVLVAYMLLVSLMKDIKRTFQYHGAEHKTIFCYEHGMPLTVENVRRERRFHPRCGTSFLILMLLVGMFISFFIDPLAILITGKVPPTIVRSLIKLLLLPIVMGVGYELIKLAGRHDNAFTRIISAPGMWLQHITVLEPDDSMIECAIKAFTEVIPEDESDKY